MLRLRTVFAPALGPLAKDYLDSVAGYIARYEAAIGPTRLEGFSVVSSPTRPASACPRSPISANRCCDCPSSVTARSVTRCCTTGGETASIRITPAATGARLTTFMADYAYARKTAAPTEPPRCAAAGCVTSARFPPGSAMPLREFHLASPWRPRRPSVTAMPAIALVMLRRANRRQSFEQGLRDFWQQWRFRSAGWKDLQHAFGTGGAARISGRLRAMAAVASAPQLRLESPASGSDLQVRLGQDRPAYQLDVPLRIITAQGAAM